jgi:hypothetical protein
MSMLELEGSALSFVLTLLKAQIFEVCFRFYLAFVVLLNDRCNRESLSAAQSPSEQGGGTKSAVRARRGEQAWLLTRGRARSKIMHLSSATVIL